MNQHASCRRMVNAAFLGAGPIAVGMIGLVMLGVSPPGAAELDGVDKLSAAGCSDEFVKQFEAGLANQDLARKSGLRCLSAYLPLRSAPGTASTSPAYSNGPPAVAQTPVSTPAPAASAPPANQVTQAIRELERLHCQSIAGTRGANLDNVLRDAKASGNPDCAILVAFAHRERGEVAKADPVAEEVIRLYWDPVKPTYPLMLYYKVAYLDGGARELGELARQPNGSALGAEARAEMLRSLEAQVADFLKDPRTVRPCPDLSARLPSDDPLRESVERVCVAIESWESALAATGLSGQARVTGLGGALTELAGAYPVNALGRSFEEPFWISREARPWLDCARAFYDAFDRANDLADTRQLQKRRTALEEAMDASRKCPESTPIAHRLPVEQVRDQLSKVKDDIQAYQRSGGVRDELQQQIAKRVRDEGSKSFQHVESWETQKLKLPSGITLSPGFSALLRTLDDYRKCKRQYNRLALGTNLPRYCEAFGPRISEDHSGGDRFVDYDRARADSVIYQALQRATGRRETSGSTSGVSSSGSGGELKAVFTYLQSDAVLKASGIKGNVQSFKNTVETNFHRAGLNRQCISPETWTAIQPEVAWTWIAFSDCRLQEGAYGDAAENLDVAARYLDRASEEHALKRLTLDRLAVLSDASKGAGKESESRAKLGLRPTSQWLADAYDKLGPARGERAQGVGVVTSQCDPTIPLQTGSSPSGRGRATVTAGFRCQSAQDFGSSSGTLRYSDDWGRLRMLAYYRALEQGAAGSPQDTLIEIERTEPGLFDVFAYWDARLSASSIPTVSPGGQWLADELRDVEAQRLRGQVNRLIIEPQVQSVVPGRTNEVRQLVLRHAFARRALELGCTRLAHEQLKLVPSEVFGSGGPLADLHNRVLAASGGEDTGTCSDVPR